MTAELDTNPIEYLTQKNINPPLAFWAWSGGQRYNPQVQGDSDYTRIMNAAASSISSPDIKQLKVLNSLIIGHQRGTSMLVLGNRISLITNDNRMADIVYLNSTKKIKLNIDDVSVSIEVRQDVIGHRFILFFLKDEDVEYFGVYGVGDIHSSIAGMNEPQAFLLCKNWAESF